VTSRFWQEQASAKEISNERTKNFFISAVIQSCSVDEENGGLVHVKRNLTLLRFWGRRRCQSDYDRFDVAMPQSLEIRKDGQHCQTNSDHQHQHSSGFGNLGRFRFFNRPFWQIHAPVSERTSRWQVR